MARLFLVFLCIIFLNTWAGNEFALSAQAQADAATRGAELARLIEDRDTGRDARMQLRMKLYDRRDRVRERALSLISLRGGPGRPVDGDRTLIRFTYPNDIEGTGFLVWDHPDAEDERFLYLPSLGRTRRIATSIADYSIHRLAPEFFGGYATHADPEVKMATPEKGLLDVLYLTAAKSRLFARLPELELPRSFRIRECRRWIAKIPAGYRRRMVADRFDAILASQDQPRARPVPR